MRLFGFPLQEVLQTNPVRVALRKDALTVTTTLGQKPLPSGEGPIPSIPRSQFVSHARGVMHLSYLTQPCMVAAHLVALQYIIAREPHYMNDVEVVAGHSLGEFSALATLGVFSPEKAMELTYQRGLLMEVHLGLANHPTHSSGSSPIPRDLHRLYACDPSRAQLAPTEDLNTSDDIFFCLVELISRAMSNTTSYLEVVNINIRHRQYVVAGDPTALAVLGKCLDPQFRVQCEVNGDVRNLPELVQMALSAVVEDRKEGLTINPNVDLKVDFVSSSARRYGVRHTFHRFTHGPDDGHTPSLDELQHLTLQEEGRSGLKRKSWFIPLPVEIPFHSSLLRRAMDDFLPLLSEALPEERVLRRLLSVSAKPNSTSNPRLPLWVVNLTGKTFRPFDKDFQEDVKEVMSSLNIGEVRHGGRYQSELVLQRYEAAIKNENVRDMCAAILAAQLAHPVLWADTMDEIVSTHNVREIHEISPVRNVSEMFKRSLFAPPPSASEEEGREVLEAAVQTKCFPADKMFFEMR